MNKETEKVMREAEKGEGVVKFETAEELFEDLGIEEGHNLRKVGDERKLICPTCEIRTTAVYKQAPYSFDVEGREVKIPDLFVAVCTECDQIARIPAQSTPAIKEAIAKARREWFRREVGEKLSLEELPDDEFMDLLEELGEGEVVTGVAPVHGDGYTTDEIVEELEEAWAEIERGEGRTLEEALPALRERLGIKESNKQYTQEQKEQVQKDLNLDVLPDDEFMHLLEKANESAKDPRGTRSTPEEQNESEGSL